MKNLPFALTSLLVAGLAGSASAAILLNETIINPTGTDDTREFVELLRTNPLDSLVGVWLLEIETDGATARGTVDLALNLSTATFGNNLLVIGHNYVTSNPYGLSAANVGLFNLARTGSTTIENDATLLLVTGFTGAVGTDYDVDNDGVLDSTPWISTLDGIVLKQAAFPTYAGATPLNYTGTAVGSTPDAAARTLGNVTPFSAASGWFGGDLLDVLPTDGVNLTIDTSDADRQINTASGSTITPGAQNVPEPASALLAVFGGGALALRRWR